MPSHSDHSRREHNITFYEVLHDYFIMLSIKPCAQDEPSGKVTVIGAGSSRNTNPDPRSGGEILQV